MKIPSYDELDELVDTDTIKLRDVAWGLVAEIGVLRERLTSAETVCTIFGWTSLGGEMAYSKAVAQAYYDWATAYGTPKPSPEWDQRIFELALKRDETRKATLAAIRGEVTP